MVFGRRPSAALLLGLLATGCPPSAFQPKASPDAGESPHSPPENVVSIELKGDRLLIAGRPVANQRTELQHALQALADYRPTLVVHSQSEADSAALTNVVREVAHAPAQTIRLELGDFKITLVSHLGNIRLGAHSSNVMGSMQGASVRLWANGANIASFTPGNAPSEAAASSVFQGQCPEKACTANLGLYDDTPLVATLRAWQKVTRDLPSALSIDIDPQPKAAPESGSPEPGARSGRLAPETIQRIVREHFKAFGVCYEAGQAHNSRLIGDVVAAFVIERDGTTSHVTNHGGNLPDEQVVDCILHELSQASFPPPPGGIVKVVYPIFLTPD